MILSAFTENNIVASQQIDEAGEISEIINKSSEESGAPGKHLQSYRKSLKIQSLLGFLLLKNPE